MTTSQPTKELDNVMENYDIRIVEGTDNVTVIATPKNQKIPTWQPKETTDGTIYSC